MLILLQIIKAYKAAGFHIDDIFEMVDRIRNEEMAAALLAEVLEDAPTEMQVGRLFAVIQNGTYRSAFHINGFAADKSDTKK